MLVTSNKPVRVKCLLVSKRWFVGGARQSASFILATTSFMRHNSQLQIRLMNLCPREWRKLTYDGTLSEVIGHDALLIHMLVNTVMK
jgi:hypothetical protein